MIHPISLPPLQAVPPLPGKREREEGIREAGWDGKQIASIPEGNEKEQR
jgi:hypothetical protein